MNLFEKKFCDREKCDRAKKSFYFYERFPDIACNIDTKDLISFPNENPTWTDTHEILTSTEWIRRFRKEGRQRCS